MPREIQVSVKLDTNGAQTSIAALEKQLQGLGSKKISIPISVELKEGAKSALKDQLTETKAIVDAQKEVQTAYERTASAEEKALQRIRNAQEKLGQSYGSIAAQQATSLAAVEKYIRSFSGMEAASVKASGAVTNAAGTFQQYKVVVAQADGTTQTFKTSVNTATGEVFQLDTGLKSISSSASGAAGALLGLATSAASSLKQIMGLTSIASLIRDSLGEMQDMSDELVTYKKVTGATADEIEEIREKSYASAKKYGQSPSDYLANVSTFARAGYKQNSSAMADLATKTQLVGDMSADAASSFLVSADAGFKLGGSIEALNSIIDKANIIDNNYATSLSSLADGFAILAPLANAMGMSVDETMAALGTISAVTQRSGTETARALRALMLNIMGDTTTEIEDGVTATEESVEGLQKVLNKYAKDAMKAASATGDVLNPMEAIAALNQAWEEGFLNDADLAMLASSLGGKLRSNELMAIVQNYDMYEEMYGKLRTEVGSADDEVSAMMDSWSAKAQNLKTAFTEITNNTIQEGTIKNLLDLGTGFVEWTGSLVNFVGVAGSALKAISALKAGLTNVFNGAKFGGMNAFTLGISAAVTAISVLKTAYENYFREMQERAEEAVEAAKEQTEKAQDVADIQKRYREIAADGIDTEAGELEELKTLQSELNSLVGDQASQIDLVNGKYGEMAQKLSAITEQQLLQAKQANDVARAAALTNYREQGLGTNTFLVRNSEAELFKNYGELNVFESFLHGTRSVKKEVVDAVQEYVSGNAKYLMTHGSWKNPNALTFSIPKVEGLEETRTLLSELQGLQSFLAGARTQSGESLATLDSGFFEEVTYEVDLATKTLTPYIAAMEQAITIDSRLAVSKSKIADTTYKSVDAFKADVKALMESEAATGDALKGSKEYKEAILEAAKAQASFEKGVDASGKALSELNAEGIGDPGSGAAAAADKFTTLTDTINAAAEAKAKFDAMMATSEEDGMNGYLTAVQTLKKELESRKFNSDAAHASYRMILGDEAYEATGGSAQELYNKYTTLAEGQLITAQKAAEMLDTVWKDTKGNEIEGVGFLKLAETLGYQLTDAMGNISLADDFFTDANMAKMAKQTGLSEDFLWSYARVLDQYDINGYATKQLEETSEQDLQAENTAALADNTAAINELGAAIGKLTVEGIEGGASSVVERPKLQADGPINQNFPSAPADLPAAKNRLATETVEKKQSPFENPLVSYSTSTKIPTNFTEADKAAEKLRIAKAEQSAELEAQLSAVLAQNASLSAEIQQKTTELASYQEQLTAKGEEIARLTEENSSTQQQLQDAQKRFADAEGNLQAQIKAANDESMALRTQNEALRQEIEWAKIQSEGAQDSRHGVSPQTTPGPPNEANTVSVDAKVDNLDTSAVAGTDVPLTGTVQDTNLGNGDSSIEMEADLNTDDAEAKKDSLEEPGEITITASVDTAAAEAALDALTQPRSVTITAEISYPSTGVSGDGGGATIKNAKHLAEGTKAHTGGPALVNDGSGPELIVDKGQAFIAGNGKPTLISLSKGAKVFTAGETRSILGGGVPAYAAGTSRTVYSTAISDSVGGIHTGWKWSDLSKDGEEAAKPSTSNKGSSKKDADATSTSGGTYSGGSNSSKSDEEAWDKLVEMVDYILNRVNKALDQQLEAIDKQIEALQDARDAAKEQNELEERQEAVAKAQKDLAEALNERTVRYLGDDGQWHWMADQGKVQSAQEKLKDAEDSLQEFLGDQAFNAQIDALEKEKERLQEEFDRITDAWDEIQDAVATPTGSLSEIISSVLSSGSDQEKKGAGAVNSTLIGALQGGIYKGNYDEALNAIAKATAGDPIMPGESDRLLADLIAKPSAATDGTAGEILAKLAATGATSAMTGNGAGGSYIGQQNNSNYYINGFQIGAEEASKPLSETMQRLSVYANGTYS